MAKVTVKIFAYIREKIGVGEVVLDLSDNAKVLDVFNVLIDKYPDIRSLILDENGALKDDLLYLLNGKDIRVLQGLNTSISDSCIFAILPPFSGGSGKYYVAECTDSPITR
ncbi:MAG: ubiquitin-like small modifier protein 1 [Candidatus Methanomethylicia archaeon]